jgi:hypothetical protein
MKNFNEDVQEAMEWECVGNCGWHFHNYEIAQYGGGDSYTLIIFGGSFTVGSYDTLAEAKAAAARLPKWSLNSQYREGMDDVEIPRPF